MPIRKLTKELQQIAENELHEVPARVNDDIKLIRDWLSTQPQIQLKSNDQWFLSYLRGSKFNYERTKQKLELLAMYKTKCLEFFGNRDPLCDEVLEVLRRGVFGLLPQTADAASPRILIMRCGGCDPAIVSLSSLIKIIFMIMDILYLEDDTCVVAGIIGVVDFKDVSYKYLPQVTPNCIKKMIECALYAYPTRIKKVFFINCPVYFPILFALIKLFAPEKIIRRIHVSKGSTNMFKYIPQSIFPEDFGGEEKDFNQLAADMKVKVKSYRKWFLD